jgi:hypothetical protein
MITYQLYSNRKPALEAMRTHPKVRRFILVKYRALVVTTRELSRADLADIETKDVFEKDCFDTLLPWVNGNIVEELHAEFLQKKRPHHTHRTRTIDGWNESRLAVIEAEKAVERAKDAERAAAKKLLLTVGKSPVNVDGVIYDPSYARESVFYMRRSRQ